jgi:hypothetical protein
MNFRIQSLNYQAMIANVANLSRDEIAVIRQRINEYGLEWAEKALNKALHGGKFATIVSIK